MKTTCREKNIIPNNKMQYIFNNIIDLNENIMAKKDINNDNNP